MIECRAPKSKKEFEQYYYLRWKILRSPWQQPEGSERDEIEEQAIHRLVVDEKEYVLAVGRLHFVDQFLAQIRYMAVDESAQGKGVGKALYQALETEAKLRGAKTVELHARESAIPFYQCLGFETVEKSHLLYKKVQHFLMRKSIKTFKESQKNSVIKLQNTWHKTIPLSKAMNIAISHYNNDYLITHCDVEFNKNLHNTMFAGSIYTLATLTGWGWVYLFLEKNSYHGDIVLAEGNIKYVAPIGGVACAQTNTKLIKGDTELLQKNKKLKFTIEINVYSGDIIAAKFSGLYVVKPKETK